MDRINNAFLIGVISDSHVPSRAKHLPPAVFTIFKDCSAIIHCGDIVSADVLAELGAIAPVFGVKGNMDPEDISLPSERTIRVNDMFTLCVWHGSGSHYGLKERAYSRFVPFMDKKPDMLIYGHTHAAEISEYGGIKVFNPGSCTNGHGFNSVGLFHAEKEGLAAEIIRL